MSKKFILVFSLLCAFSVLAQNDSNIDNSSQGVCVDCENLLYGFNKATALTVLSINNASSAEAIGQYYNAPQAITVHGVDFYAYQIVESKDPININIEIYLADVDFLPTGAPLASKTIPFIGQYGTGTLAELKTSVLFDAPVTVTQPYVIVLANPSADGVGVGSNGYNATPPDGLGEFLASVKIGADWLRGSDVNIGGVPFDADALLEPLVSYSLDTDFIITPAEDDGSHFVSLENNSSPVLADRMYNQAAFINQLDLSHTYDLGDGSEATGPDASHTYQIAGLYSIKKTDMLFGWERDLTNSTTKQWGIDVDLIFKNGF